ncbi:MAG: PBP1A family penicillin-binding protein, partial [Pseudomonadota bacterium]
MADDDRGGLRAFDQDRPPSGDDDGGGGWFSQLGLTLKLVALGFGGLVVVGVIGLVAAAIYVASLTPQLPDYEVLAEYEPPITTRVHAGDGSLIAEFARERRLFVPVGAIPDHVKRAFISAEDKSFYEHGGIDPRGIMRAALANATAYITGSGRLEGASTITQQVAKNFLLSSERTIERKVKEQVLALRIERAYTKDEILELYLNEIYLGNRSYGVAAAALNYFEKALDQLSIDEAAYLAALPKAPNNYHPVRATQRATQRRNWVIDRMVENGYITAETAAEAKARELVATTRPVGAQFAAAEYFAEEVRKKVYDIYGEEALYDGGLSVRTTLDRRLQQIARTSLRNGLVAYDRRHGWRGASATISLGPDWDERLNDVPSLLDIDPWRLAVVLEVRNDEALIGVKTGQTGSIPLEELLWARSWDSDAEALGAEITSASEVLSAGDIIYVEPIAGARSEGGLQRYALRQQPKVNGAITAIDPHTGRVLAMIGGFSFQASQFNRATQARRQPGSAFKPFVYAAALDRGYSPSSLILDAPFVAPVGGLETGWYSPGNYTDRFYGESTLRRGIEQSRNVMTVRLAQDIGMDPIINNAKGFGIADTWPPVLSISLGAGETTLMRLTTAYAILVNGGKKIEPVLIDRVQDRYGQSIYKQDPRECLGCSQAEWTGQAEPALEDPRPQTIDSRTAFQVGSMLEGGVQRGTGRTVSVVERPLAG